MSNKSVYRVEIIVTTLSDLGHPIASSSRVERIHSGWTSWTLLMALYGALIELKNGAENKEGPDA